MAVRTLFLGKTGLNFAILGELGNLVIRENFAIFDSTWIHILAPKGPDKEFLKQYFS